MNDHPIDKHASPCNPDAQTPENGVSPQGEMNLAELQTTCEQLRKKVQELEVARARDREALTIMQMERDGMAHFLEMFGDRPISAEELQEIMQRHGCQPLEYFIADLEKIVNK